MVIDPLGKFSTETYNQLIEILDYYQYSDFSSSEVEDKIANLWESGNEELRYFRLSDLYEDKCNIERVLHKEEYKNYNSYNEIPFKLLNYLEYRNIKWNLIIDYSSRYRYVLWVKHIYNFDYLDLYLGKKSDTESKQICSHRGWVIEDLMRCKRLWFYDNFDKVNEKGSTQTAVLNMFLKSDVLKWIKENNLGYSSYTGLDWIAFENPVNAASFRMLYF